MELRAQALTEAQLQSPATHTATCHSFALTPAAFQTGDSSWGFSHLQTSAVHKEKSLKKDHKKKNLGKLE